MIYINGRFLTQKITGVQRHALEVVKEFDRLNLDEEIVILHPKGIINKPELKNIKLCQIGNCTGHLWEQVSLPLYILKNNKKAKLISFCNIAPVLFPGYVYLHDISFKTYSKHLNWKFALWYRLITRINVKRYKHIFTISEFSKKEIMDEYHVKENKITITYCSAEHMKDIDEDDKILEKLNLKKNEFNFTLGSRSPHKNIKYIIEMAKYNKDETFVISGNQNRIFNDVNEEKLDNIIYTGYISDSEIVSLYKNCKCFIFPSLFEGFGIPPLEALILGCKNVFLSDIPVFREIYGDTVNYLDLSKSQVKINELIGKYDKSKVQGLLKKYTWSNVATKVIENLYEDK